MNELNLQIVLFICVLAFLLYFIFNFNIFNLTSLKEELENKNNEDNNNVMFSSSGVGANASNYVANIKAQVIKMQDILLIKKYKSEYENSIINLDDLVNSMMLKLALNIDVDNPINGLEKLTKLNQTKVALNNVMKFIDTQ